MPQMNWNVKVAYVYCISSSMAWSIWGDSVAAAYIFLISGRSNKFLGYSEGAQGVAQLLPGLLGGWLADTHRRDRVVAFSGTLAAFFGVALILVVVSGLASEAHWLDEPYRKDAAVSWRYLLFTAGLCGESAAWAIGGAAEEALIADSVPTGGRTAIYTRFMIVECLAESVGPLIAAALFYFWLGEHWTARSLATVIVIGMFCDVPSVVCAYLYRDGEALGKTIPAVDPSSTSLLLIPQVISYRRGAGKDERGGAGAARGRQGGGRGAAGGARGKYREHCPWWRRR